MSGWREFWHYPGRGLAFCLLASCLLLACVGLLTTSCAAPSKEAAIQHGINAAFLACESLKESRDIPREPQVDEFCELLATLQAGEPR